MVKKIATWGSIAFLIFFVATRPADASNIITTAFGGVENIGNGFSDFVSGLL